jgi:predicted NUDIX family NTP pyrophosphohydrolase
MRRASAATTFSWNGRPEADIFKVAEARWMRLAEAREMMLRSQLPLLDALEQKLSG